MSQLKYVTLAMVFILLMSMLLWVRGTYYQWYDPDLSLPLRLDNAIFESNSMVLYMDMNCPCNLLSAAHIESLRSNNHTGISQFIWLPQNQWSKKTAAKLALQFSLEPERITPAPDYWQSIVKKTPTVILFNADGSLAYLGPVSSGLSCNSSSSFIDLLLDKMLSNSRVDGIINSQVKGCFCDLE